MGIVTDLELLGEMLEDLSAELMTLGTPITVRRDVKALLRRLPTIEVARRKSRS